MIYGNSLTFDKLIERITELNERFRKIDFNIVNEGIDGI